MRAVAARWPWGLSGLVVIAAVAVPGGVLITRGGDTGFSQQNLSAVPTKTVTVDRQVTTLDVRSYGAPIQVIGAPVRQVKIDMAIMFDPKDGPPTVTHSVDHGRLTLAAPACEQSNCSVGFTVTVPRDVAVTAQSSGGIVTVSGVAAANLDSGGGLVRVLGVPGTLTVNAEGGPVIASSIAGGNLDSGGGPVTTSNVNGPLTVNTEGGGLTLMGLSGPLDADTGGGPLQARGIAAVTATANTEGGNTDIGFITAPQAVTVDSGGGTARLGFVAAPRKVTVSTEGGNAIVTVPGGPYALSANSEGGPESVGIATDPAAVRAITVDTGGGMLWIQPGTGQGVAPKGSFQQLPSGNNTASAQPAKPAMPASPPSPAAP